MKTILSIAIHIIQLAAFVMLVDITTYAQRPVPQNRFSIGVDAGVGTRTFSLSSDIEALDGLNVSEQGYNLGVFFGGEFVHMKLGIGIYHVSGNMPETVDLDQTEMGIHLFPLQLLRAKNNRFKPYLLSELVLNNMTFFGSYEVPDPIAEKIKEMNDDPEAESVAVTTTQPGENRETGKLSDLRMNVGAGALYMIPCHRLFVKLFAEAKYGIGMATVPWSSGFINTRVSSPVSVNVGIGVGLKNY